MKRACNNCAHCGGGVLCGRGHVIKERGFCSQHQTWKEANPEDYARDHGYFDEERGKWMYFDFDKNEMTPEFRSSCQKVIDE